MEDSLRDRVALVTGGARGLGEAICRELAGAGAVVVVADVRDELAKSVAADVERAGGRASALHLDVTSDGDAADAVRAVTAEHGRVDVLVNNAGIDVTASVDELTVEQWDRICAVNLRGPFVMARLVLPGMRARGSGHVVNVASTASKRTWPNASAYHATKWGLLGLSHALHAEARPAGVKVTAVVAGGMRTPFLLERFPELDPGVLQDPRNVARTVRFVLTQPAETVVPEVMVIPMGETSWP
ncbi:MAG TPA: SDR family oxidoreductase [Actinomycetota bacterium]|nr:SDR family oxidoreductase [Actinomycetota bacterium]